MKQVIIGLVVLVVVACGGEPGETARDGMPMPQETMDAMPMPSLDLLPAVRNRVDSLRTAPAHRIPDLVAGYRAHVDTLLAAMATDMGAMGMPADAAWRSLEDSVRTDLAVLETLDGEALVLRARAHAGRLGRLMARHEMMMRM